METIYWNTKNVVRRDAPIVDLNEYRRNLERQRALEAQAPEPECCAPETDAPEQGGLWALLRGCRRPESLGELMDVVASAAMVLTALVAAVAVLR